MQLKIYFNNEIYFWDPMKTVDDVGSINEGVDIKYCTMYISAIYNDNAQFVSRTFSLCDKMVSNILNFVNIIEKARPLVQHFLSSKNRVVTTFQPVEPLKYVNFKVQMMGQNRHMPSDYRHRLMPSI